MAIIGAGGIGFDVAEYLVHEGTSPTEDLALWKAEWGVGDPEEQRGGLVPGGAATRGARAAGDAVAAQGGKAGPAAGQDHRVDSSRGACR